jgi:dihydroorotase
MPGLVDSRVFIGEPGGEYRETIASASEAAAAGGVTSIIMMPDTDPVIDDVALGGVRAAHGPRHRTGQCLPGGGDHQAVCMAQEMTEFGLLRKKPGPSRFTDGRRTIRSSAGDAPRADLCPRLSVSLLAHETHDHDLGSDGVMNEGISPAGSAFRAFRAKPRRFRSSAT